MDSDSRDLDLTGWLWRVRARWHGAPGTGSVDGEAGFGFVLSEIDEGKGSADRFRLAVWDDASGELIYDNLRGAPYFDRLPDSTAIKKGDITIHTRTQ